MRILYPQNPLNQHIADDLYTTEWAAAREAGYACSLFDFDALAFNSFKPRPSIEAGDRVLYRGWMLTPAKYDHLATQIKQAGGNPITTVADYVRCHHLPGWYKDCDDLTAETHFFADNDDLEIAVDHLGWDRYFVKDYVKSNTAGKGSIAQSSTEVRAIADQLKLYRGAIEGGLAIRRVEHYLQATEQRYFVVQGVPYARDGIIPEIVQTVANRIAAPFYSVDIIENSVGTPRLVELGDGQVSDKKNWPLAQFMTVIAANDTISS